MSPEEDNLLGALRQFIKAEVAAQSAPGAAHAQHVTIALAATLTGLSGKAIRRKIEEGKWLEGREYRRRGIMPKPLELGPRARGYRQSTLRTFLESREVAAS